MQIPATNQRLRNAYGQSRVGVLVIVVVLLCLAGAAFYHFRTQSPNAFIEPGTGLSQSTHDLLKSLDKPVQLRFYAILDPATVPPSTRAFASRVEGLLDQFERESAGKISVVRSSSDAQAAAADGIQPFNIELGNACFLGIAAVQGEARETLPRLSPRWEHALEADLSRMIERVVEARPSQPVPEPTAVDPSVIAEVRRIVPDPAAVPLEQGKQRLRAVALQEFKEAVAEMEARVKQAEEELARAQSSGSESERAAAAKRLDEAQAAQAQRIKEIAARSQSRIEAFEKLKAAATP